ncbi:MAG TPA: ubiquinol-cytochrome c reductase iron-sulfur subunit [Caulobacteraceae bacterium]|jgi:ubiquinol-cytochrome c reductase iron-sulfur subunit|nr:ubiquinol-cytochrome c reductase iron-sulfur subunit [Caulobacteraceae bacterium]
MTVEARDASRRDFIHLLTGAMAVGGAAAVAWPFIDQLNPAGDVLAAGAPVTVDISKMAPGQQIVVLFQGSPMFVVYRTPANLAELQKPSTLGMLRDPNSETKQQPPYAKNWSRSIKPEYLVLVGVCTHLGCTPGYQPSPGSVNATWPGGWLCPCHGSKYDLAGRVFKSVPAPMNLPVPPYAFASPTTITIGKNPEGETFAMADIATM